MELRGENLRPEKCRCRRIYSNTKCHLIQPSTRQTQTLQGKYNIYILLNLPSQVTFIPQPRSWKISPSVNYKKNNGNGEQTSTTSKGTSKHIHSQNSHLFQKNILFIFWGVGGRGVHIASTEILQLNHLCASMDAFILEEHQPEVFMLSIYCWKHRLTYSHSWGLPNDCIRIRIRMHEKLFIKNK